MPCARIAAGGALRTLLLRVDALRLSHPLRRRLFCSERLDARGVRVTLAAEQRLSPGPFTLRSARLETLQPFG